MPADGQWLLQSTKTMPWAAKDWVTIVQNKNSSLYYVIFVTAIFDKTDKTCFK